MKSLLNIFSKKDACLLLTNLQGVHVEKYRSFTDFLKHNNNALKTIADMEQIFYSGRPFSLPFMKLKYKKLRESVTGVIESLEAMSGKEFPSLKKGMDEIDTALSKELNPAYHYVTRDFVLPFEDITPELKNMVGAKAGHLAFINNSLGLPVPEGFAITAFAFERFMEENKLAEQIEDRLSGLSPDFAGNLESISDELITMIMASEVPQNIIEAIMKAYHALEAKTQKGVRISMRSSAIGEDTEATFAGQYTTVLNVTEESIINSYKTVIASKYSPRAISYRLHYGLDDHETPMCVAGVTMIDSKASGVIYTVDDSAGNADLIKISSIWGLGEHLVDGSASPDIFLVDKESNSIRKKEIRRKEYRLITIHAGGTKLEKVPELETDKASLDDDTVMRLADYSLKLERAFGNPQDIEWAVDKKGSLFILQSRPIGQGEKVPEKASQIDLTGYQILLSGGQNASSGAAAGKVFIIKEGIETKDVPEQCILVAKTASPDYAKLMTKIKGIITDIGSVTSHLSSVAREFGIPVIVDTKNATTVLQDGELITMSAVSTSVYKGIIEELAGGAKPTGKLIFGSPVQRRMRDILDRISPLNLTSTESPSFSPEGCKTLHDIIRFTHETAVKEMFGLTEEAEEIRSIKLTASIPLTLHLIDVGGGLQQGLTTCHVVTPEHIASLPMKAIWKGFTHPGITWSGAIGVDMKKFVTLFATSLTSEAKEEPGGTSYAIISGEYMNLSAKFGYHFATIDTLCSENSNQNYISLQFAGGAGDYYGKSLRVSYLGNVLKRLGFEVSFKGDLLEAFLIGYDRPSMEEKLDQTGRLLASSRLLDMALSNQHDIDLFTDSFFKGEYDFLSPKRDDQPKDFYVHNGYWKRSIEDGHVYCVQDGSKSGFTISSGVAGVAGKFLGASLQDFLDNIEAYYYFPLAIAKHSDMEDGTIRMNIKAVGGHIDRAGGIAFGIQNAGNYFVLRMNALEDNVILFEYKENKRSQRVSVTEPIESQKWYELAVEISGRDIKGYLDGKMVLEYTAEKPVMGLAGLWTKADSVTYFDNLTIKTETGDRKIAF
jgi:pyruvate, water dikinase